LKPNLPITYTKASLTRCSQPLSGVQKRSSADEELVQMIFSSNEEIQKPGPGGKKRNLILDARPRVNAYGNAAMGKGFENTEYYPNCSRIFFGIENIHVMRDSLNKLLEGFSPFHFVRSKISTSFILSNFCT